MESDKILLLCLHETVSFFGKTCYHNNRVDGLSVMPRPDRGFVGRREDMAEKKSKAVKKVSEPEIIEEVPQPGRSVAFIGSECYPFVKTGGLGDVMYALPKALTRLNCDVKVILPRYRCIPEKYQEKMVYRGEFTMDLCADGRSYYVGIMEYVWDGVVYDFIDNEEFFGWGNPYTNLVMISPSSASFPRRHWRR